MKKYKTIFTRFFISVLFMILGLVLIVSTASGKSNYMSPWRDKYPGSDTDAASCLICHISNTSEHLNSYGRDICLDDGTSLAARLAAVESADSDGDGHSNLVEIEANAQPGWTTGQNPYYDSSGIYKGTMEVPDAVPQPYDPPVPMDWFIFLPLVVSTD
jgi:hypothetical protein